MRRPIGGQCRQQSSCCWRSLDSRRNRPSLRARTSLNFLDHRSTLHRRVNPDSPFGKATRSRHCLGNHFCLPLSHWRGLVSPLPDGLRNRRKAEHESTRRRIAESLANGRSNLVHIRGKRDAFWSCIEVSRRALEHRRGLFRRRNLVVSRVDTEAGRLFGKLTARTRLAIQLPVIHHRSLLIRPAQQHTARGVSGPYCYQKHQIALVQPPLLHGVA